MAFSISPGRRGSQLSLTRLAPDGIFSGYTIAEKPGGKQLSHHEHEFTGKDELLSVLQPHFQNVTVFETHYPERHNLYWWASEGAVPFGADWQQAVRA